MKSKNQRGFKDTSNRSKDRLVFQRQSFERPQSSKINKNLLQTSCEDIDVSISEITEMCYMLNKHVMELETYEETYQIIKDYEESQLKGRILKVKEYIGYQDGKTYHEYLKERADYLWNLIQTDRQ